MRGTFKHGRGAVKIYDSSTLSVERFDATAMQSRRGIGSHVCVTALVVAAVLIFVVSQLGARGEGIQSWSGVGFITNTPPIERLTLEVQRWSMPPIPNPSRKESSTNQILREDAPELFEFRSQSNGFYARDLSRDRAVGHWEDDYWRAVQFSTQHVALTTGVAQGSDEAGLVDMVRHFSWAYRAFIRYGIAPDAKSLALKGDSIVGIDSQGIRQSATLSFASGLPVSASVVSTRNGQPVGPTISLRYQFDPAVAPLPAPSEITWLVPMPTQAGHPPAERAIMQIRVKELKFADTTTSLPRAHFSPDDLLTGKSVSRVIFQNGENYKVESDGTLTSMKVPQWKEEFDLRKGPWINRFPILKPLLMNSGGEGRLASYAMLGLVVVLATFLCWRLAGRRSQRSKRG